MAGTEVALGTANKTPDHKASGVERLVMQDKNLSEYMRLFLLDWEDEVFEATESEALDAFRTYVLRGNDSVFRILGKYV